MDSLLRQIREGRNADEASNFARWVEFSGILQILKASSVDVPLRVDGFGLAEKVRLLNQECGEWYSLHERSNKPRDAYVSQSKLDMIEERLAAIEGKLFSSDAPALTIIDGQGQGGRAERGPLPCP